MTNYIEDLKIQNLMQRRNSMATFEKSSSEIGLVKNKYKKVYAKNGPVKHYQFSRIKPIDVNIGNSMIKMPHL